MVEGKTGSNKHCNTKTKSNEHKTKKKVTTEAEHET